MSVTDTGGPLSADTQLAHRHMLAVRDMQEVLAYLNTYRAIVPLLMDHNPEAIVETGRGMLTAAIVAYCRSFKRSETRGNATPRLDAADLQAVGIRRALHDLLLYKRDKFVAHGDWEERKVEVVISGETDIHVSQTEPEVWAGVDVGEFMILAQGIQYECLTKTLAHGRAAQEGASAT